jgi:hypothetical protein
VFVFQGRSTLTVASGSQVVLIGGAQACNVFWQVGSSATIGSSSTFVGSILALTSISLTTGATLNGRALARNGAVTLDTNTVTKTTCSTQTPPPTTIPGPGPGPGPGDSTGASARLSGPSGCVTRPFWARVSGRQIDRVTFFVDAKRRRTVNTNARRTVFSLRVNALKQSPGTHRITATVNFSADSHAKARTLRLVYQRCPKTAPKPQFTG